MAYNTSEELEEEIFEFENLVNELHEEKEKDVPSISVIDELLEKLRKKFDRVKELDNEL